MNRHSPDRDDYPDLEMDHDIAAQRWEWRFQRVGWVAMAALVVGAVVGVFGSGPLSRSTAGDEETLKASYIRFARNETPAHLEVEFGAGAVRDGKAELWVSRTFADAVRVDSINPEPDSSRTEAEWVVYAFTAGEQPPFAVSLRYTPESRWRLRAQLRAGPDSPPVALSQFIFP